MSDTPREQLTDWQAVFGAAAWRNALDAASSSWVDADAFETHLYALLDSLAKSGRLTFTGQIPIQSVPSD